MMPEIEPVEANIDGMPDEEPFLKFRISDEATLIVDKVRGDYNVRVEDEQGNVLYPGTKMPEDWWKSKRKVGGLINDFNESKKLPEFDKNRFRRLIAPPLEDQLDLWTDLKIERGEEMLEKGLEAEYSEEAIQKAEHLLNEQNVLKKVKTVMDHRIAGEDLNKLGVFLQLLSKDTDKPMMIFGVQKHGEGKSYIAQNVLNLFPEHMVIDVTDMTKAALYRRAQDDPHYFDGKIVYFGEIPERDEDRDIFQIFRQLVSEGKVSKELVIERDGEMKAVNLQLKGNPCILSTTINPGLIDDQDMSRGMAYSPELSQEQNKEVRSFQNREREFPEHVLNPKEIEELEEVITCALDILAEDNINIQNPFARDLDKQVPKDTDNIKRDYPKTLRIASELPARLYHRQRPKQEIQDKEYTFVTWKDVVRGMTINRKFINNMIRGRTESAMDAYKLVKENIDAVDKSYEEMPEFIEQEIVLDSPGENFHRPVDEEDSFTNRDLVKWMGVASETAREYTRKLDRMELIYKDSSTKPHEHYLVKENRSETAGITLQSIYNIVESVFNQEELSDWAKDYLSFTGLKGSKGKIIEKVGLTEEDLPVELDLGTVLDDHYTTPAYMRLSEQQSEIAESLRVDKDDGELVCGFRRGGEKVIEEINGDN